MSEIAIYGSTQYVDPSKNHEWYQLEVINQWDWKTKVVCYRTLNGICIPYGMSKHISNGNYTSSAPVNELTQEMKQELVRMGYSISKPITNQQQ